MPSSTTAFSTLLKEGNSNITSSNACSIIERNPRAPVLRSNARLAIAPNAASRNSSSTPSMANSFWYCLVNAFLGSVRILISAFTSNSSSVATTGRRPTNSGIKPYLIKSSGSTSRNNALFASRSAPLFTSAPKPIPVFAVRI